MGPIIHIFVFQSPFPSPANPFSALSQVNLMPPSNASPYPPTPTPGGPLTPGTPVSEGSGIIPQLQYVLLLKSFHEVYSSLEISKINGRYVRICHPVSILMSVYC